MGVVARSVAFTMWAVLLSGCLGTSEPERVFEDFTLSSGLAEYRGMTFGAAWGDFDGDGLPDLYVTNHLNAARLYRNLGDGRFADVTSDYFAAEDLGGDKHGAAWADVTNDGRLDLVQVTGALTGVGAEPKKLFLNRGDRFEDMAAAWGVDNPEGRTRMPLWVDLEGNGRLDLLHGAEARLDDRVPPLMFLHTDEGFVAAGDAVPFASRAVPFCVLTDLTNDGHSEMVCRVIGQGRTAQIFSTASFPVEPLELLPVSAFEDIAAGDFDNDGSIDLFLARKDPAGAVAVGRPGSNEAIADLQLVSTDVDQPQGFSFRSAGRLQFQIDPRQPKGWVTFDDIRIGEEGWNPGALEFGLSVETARVAGIAPPAGTDGGGVHIGYTAPDRWQVDAYPAHDRASGNRPRAQQVAIRILSSEPITDLETNGEEAPARLFMNRGGELVEESGKRGVNAKPCAGVNAVAGDFNNNMHLDLYVVCSGDVGNQENLLLLNRGDGRFRAVPGAGGAAGPRSGVGDSVTTVDFDGDGFLDLLVATGGSMGRSLGLPSDAGGYYLYRNVGNDNNWLQIDLEGTTSNRDGIGARVFVTAGGITQTRVQDGGIHHRGQNHSRLHFGLARNDRVDEIRVQWPSGVVQELLDVKPNQVLRIRESTQ